MVKRSYKSEEVVAKLRQADVLHSQGMTIADAVREIGVSEVTFYRWRKDYGGMKADQLKRIKELEKAEVAPVFYISPRFRGPAEKSFDFNGSRRCFPLFLNSICPRPPFNPSRLFYIFAPA